jgi:hypothetical protein
LDITFDLVICAVKGYITTVIATSPAKDFCKSFLEHSNVVVYEHFLLHGIVVSHDADQSKIPAFTLAQITATMSR